MARILKVTIANPSLYLILFNSQEIKKILHPKAVTKSLLLNIK